MAPRIRKVSVSLFHSQPLSNPSPRCQCLRQQTERPFSSTSSRNSTRLRDAMYSWLNGPGAVFRHPLPGSTNYLSAYDPSGRLIRATDKKRPKDPESDADMETETPTLEKNIQGEQEIPKETLDDLMPFPMNRQFRSEPVLSEELKDRIFQLWKEEGKSVRRISADMQVEMRRVGAVLRLKSVEEEWKNQGKPLATPYARAILSMLPVTRYTPHLPITAHEPINDLPVHSSTLRQVFHPVSESRRFTRTDAGRVFHPTLLPADERIPHPELIDAYRDLSSGMSAEEREMAAQRREKKEADIKEAKRRIWAEEEERRVKKVEAGRWEFRFRDISVEDAGRDGRGRKGVGARYGMPHEDRKKGIVKIPRRVE
ncbi:MAG: hypothetical protein Q9195_007452 [Heterodermia aff. obscurata]